MRRTLVAVVLVLVAGAATGHAQQNAPALDESRRAQFEAMREQLQQLEQFQLRMEMQRLAGDLGVRADRVTRVTDGFRASGNVVITLKDATLEAGEVVVRADGIEIVSGRLSVVR